MRVKRFAALMLALLFAAVLVPSAGSAADMEYEANYGEYFSIFLWEGYDSVDDLAVISGSLPPGIHIIKDYDDSSGAYDFYAAGAPTAVGTYLAQIEIRPNGAMYSYFSLEITVITPIKIKTKTLAQATYGVYYQTMIETNYPYANVEFVEIWNPGIGVVLPYLGLSLADNGMVYGTPKRTGTYYIYIGAYAKGNNSYDEAMIKLVIKDADPVDPTDPPVSGPEIPKCVFSADSILYYEQGVPFDWSLVESLDASTQIGTVGLPDFMEFVFHKENGTIHLTGKIPGDVKNTEFETDLPLTVDGHTWYVHYILRPTPADKLSGYPSANELPVSF